MASNQKTSQLLLKISLTSRSNLITFIENASKFSMTKSRLPRAISPKRLKCHSIEISKMVSNYEDFKPAIEDELISPRQLIKF